MAKVITLPSGHTVTLRDVSTIRVKDRNKVMAASDRGEGETSKMLAIGDALIAILVQEWSFDLIIPSVRIESLGELEIPDYDALTEHTKEAQQALFPKLSETPETASDPDSPFGNSNDSVG